MGKVKVLDVIFIIAISFLMARLLGAIAFFVPAYASCASAVVTPLEVVPPWMWLTSVGLVLLAILLLWFMQLWEKIT